MSESGWLDMFIQEFDDVPDNLGEKQVSMNPKETFENQSEGDYLEIFEKELDPGMADSWLLAVLFSLAQAYF